MIRKIFTTKSNVAALKPIFDLADRLDDDQETQSLLRTIAADERSTLEFFHEACALLNPA